MRRAIEHDPVVLGLAEHEDASEHERDADDVGDPGRSARVRGVDVRHEHERAGAESREEEPEGAHIGRALVTDDERRALLEDLHTMQTNRHRT
jgi:hypothetical protein